MDHKELGTNSSVNTGVSDGSTKFALTNGPTVQSSRNKLYDVGSNSLGKVDATSARPCAIIGPDRVLPPNPDDTMYLKKMPGEAWPPPDNAYRRPPDYPSKASDYQPIRNISPRQTFQENMQRIMVPPTFSSIKTSEVSNLKNTKLNMPQEAKYCDVPYNVNSVNSEHKSVRNPDIPMSNVNPAYTRNMPPPYGWPTGVNIRPLRPYAAPEFYQYQEFPSCAGPRSMTMIRPHQPLNEESAQVYSERLYQDANIRFKPYPTGKEKHQQPRYDYVSNYPNTFHPPASLPPHKYDLQKSVHGHAYPVYPQVPYKYIDRRLHEPFVDGYHRSHSQQANFNAFHGQVVPPPYGPIPGNCMQNKTYSESFSKPMNINKIQFENSNKVYLNLESRNKNYSVPENIYYNDMNHSQAMRGEILLPTQLNNPPIQHSIYRKDNTPLKPYDYNPNYRLFDQPINANHSLQRLPVQFSPNTLAISPSDSNTSNDTTNTMGTSQEDCGYVSQSSTASMRSFDSGNVPMSHDFYRRHSYNNYDMVRNIFHPIGPVQIPRNKTGSSNKKNLDVRQFLQMWNEGDEEGSEASKEAAVQNHAKKNSSQNEIINNQEQLYVLGLVNVPNEDLGKYDHIQKISKLPENIKGYKSIEILNQYEELLETPRVTNYNRSREYNVLSKSQIDKDITTKMPRPVSPLDVEAKISQSVIHKEVGCNFEIKPCSPEMLNVEVAAPVHNILDERMIEKVVNPIISNSPNLNRGENNKSQNTVNDVVNVASCKMISNQYSSNSSPNSKPSNYSVHDLESNAGLCLASLPQLDNDMELNFPEINQQFIKANQIGHNVESSLQNLPHIDIEQTHTTHSHCLPHETRNDFLQQNLSQLVLGSGVDKEFSKLSKYRKGRKCELTSSQYHMATPDVIKSSESLAVLQRIDSVIIKNPDTNKSQDNEPVKIMNETHYSFQNDTESYSSKYEKNIETLDLPSETAIDFSFNRSEETAVNYLNAIDRNINQNLPTLEGFDEGLNEGEISLTSSSIEVHDTSANVSITQSAELDEDPQYKHLELVRNEKYKNNEQNIIEEIKVPVKSPKISLANEDYNVLVIKNMATTTPKLPIIENVICTQSTTKIEIPELNIQDNDSKHQDYLIEESQITNPKITLTKGIEPESADESKNKIEMSIPIKPITDKEDPYNHNHILGNKSEISLNTKMIVDSDDVTENQTIEEVLEEMDLSNQDIDNLDAKSSPSHKTVNNVMCDVQDTTASNNSFRKNEEMIEVVSSISLVSETNKETIDIVLQNSDIGITRTDSITYYQPVTSEPNIDECKLDVNDEESVAAVFEQGSKTEIKNSPAIMSSYSKIISCKNHQTNLHDLAIELTKHNQQSENSYDKEEDSKIKMGESEYECLCVKNVIHNYDQTVLSMSTETFSEETHNESGLSAKKLDVSESDYLSNVLEPISDYKEDTLKNETKTYLTSFEFEKSKKLSITKEDKEEFEKNIHKAESYLFNKVDTINDNSIEEPYYFDNKVVHDGPDAIITEYKQNTKIEVHVDNGESECSNDSIANNVEDNKVNSRNCAVTIAEYRQATDINTHLQFDNGKTIVSDFKESCLSTKTLGYPENHPVITMKCRHETEIVDNLLKNYEPPIEKAESEVISGESYVISISPVRESDLFSNNEIFEETVAISLDCCQEIGTNSSIPKDFKTYLDTAVSESTTHSPNIIKEAVGQETTPENSIYKTVENKKIIDVNVSELVSVSKLDRNDPNIVDNTSKFKDKTEPLKIHKSFQTWQYQTQDSVINIEHANFQKELFSPWFQKLLMFTEGTYNLRTTNKNKNSIENENNCGKITAEKDNDRSLNDVLFDNYHVKPINASNIVNNEFCEVDKEVNLLNNMLITNKTLQSEQVKEQVVRDDGSLTETYQNNKKEDTQLSAAVIDNSTCIKPRKICKRSLSESALEAYKDNDDINFVQPCKRKKGINDNQSFLESHMITEDICNIIQTNRRNSISTFYNEDNVYIVIDNDLILTEENDDSDKLYTENAEELLTSIEPTNCEISLNLETNSCTDELNEVAGYSDSLQHIEDKSIVDSWVDDVACIETVFSEDVAENIIIDVQASPKKVNFVNFENVDEESTVFYESDHIDKLKTIYGRTICNENTKLIETLYNTPQMNVNKTLYHIESQDSGECLDAVNDRCLDSNTHNNCTDILESGISSYKVIDNKENMSDIMSLHSEQCSQIIYPNFNHNNEFKFDEFSSKQEDKFTMHLCESSNDYLTSNIQKENSSFSYSSSPEVSSTTSEEKNSSILLKITNCNGSRVSQINDVSTDVHNKLSYKLTETREYRSYNSNFSTSRTLITKAAQKYIPPLKEPIYDLKVKLPLPKQRLHTLKNLKVSKVEPKADAANICAVKRLNHDISKKQKPKFEDVLKSIDEINFKKHKDNIKKGKILIPKVIIKKNENGAHYASSKIVNRQETYNPDLTGRKWQPWVFLDKNDFIDKMALQNKAKAVYCHRKNSYILLEKFRKYKSVYNANFVISQPKSETKGNLKYTIRLKH